MPMALKSLTICSRANAGGHAFHQFGVRGGVHQHGLFQAVGRLAGEGAGKGKHQVVNLAGHDVVVVDAISGEQQDGGHDRAVLGVVAGKSHVGDHFVHVHVQAPGLQAAWAGRIARSFRPGPAPFDRAFGRNRRADPGRRAICRPRMTNWSMRVLRRRR